MKLLNTYKYLIILSLFFSCSKNQIVQQPDVNIGDVDFISYTKMKSMEGIYSGSGSTGLGTNFVCKVSKYRVSFFSNSGGIFMILKYGLNPTDSSLKFSGFWRFSETATQGLINFSVPKAEALLFLTTGDISSLSLSGSYQNGDDPSIEPLNLTFSKHFSAYAANTPFEIYSHHGVQTTSNPPFAQNSLNGVYNDEDYGVNGLEMDVQLTYDSIPIMMHDADIDIRLTQKSPISGNYNQYKFQFLEDYIRLVDGQKIPALAQMLTAFIDSTTMKYFWMDIKGDEGIFEALLPVIDNAYNHAKAVGRDVVIYADLPSNTVIGQFQSYPAYRESGYPTMCELTYQDVVDNGCTRWGPRYSRGLLLSDVETAHAAGIKVISWTLNDKTLIQNYIKNGQFDGFISDYPSYVVYDYYTTK
jgi:glycerophosphoryl diester phosphodiesterase